tara:strand:+ start:187 stop:633 length:447 start_codon:yes stop_codon:yes gene_type:complete
MFISSNKNFNSQAFLSYLGILPFIYVLIDIHIINIFFINILKDFIIFYSLLIFTFIGAMRWSFNNYSNMWVILYGFLPSLISTILIIIFLIKNNQNTILFFIFLLLIIQMFVDFLISKKNYEEKHLFLIVRLPLTIIITLNIFYLIFV